MDHQEGFGGAVEGAGSQGVAVAGDDVALVVIGVRGFAEGEFRKSLIAVILVLEHALQGVEKVAWKR